MLLVDYVVIVLAVALLLTAGFWFSRRGGRTSGDFILGGRRLPWWLAGTAMVAGSSNADSPLHQSGKIRRDGLTGAWFYWSQVLHQIAHSLVFSRLWRRAEIQTVVEFYDIRYAGKAKVAGRIWSMVVASFIEGTLGLALGMLAMIKICTVLLGLDQPVVIFGGEFAPELVIAVVGVALAVSYSTVAGLLGVVAGDIVEFLIAMTCSYLLMFIVYREVGYADGLAAGLARLGEEAKLSFSPALGISFFVFFFLQPFASMAGTNGINQRYMALRDEREAMLSGMWRIVNHFFIRGWPWYICGLASIILITDASLPREMAYPQLIADYMPAGLRGLMFAGFLVAFMSSVSSSMHSAGAVFVNDFYRPFVRPKASDRHYVWAMRVAMLLFALVGTVIALSADNVLGLLQFLMQMLAASGLVMLLRWFWWRINGWTDLAAQMLALPVTLFYTHAGNWFGPKWDLVTRISTALGSGSADDRYGVSFILTVGTTTLLWLIVMAVTRPEPMDTLQAFYRRVRPYGWWRRVAEVTPDVKVTDSIMGDAGLYVLGLVTSLGLLFGFGLLLLGRFGVAIPMLIAALAAGFRLVRVINRRYAPAGERHGPATF